LGVYKYFKSFWTALDFIIAMVILKKHYFDIITD